MAKILNRSQYGNLSCLWGVFKANFTKVDDELRPNSLKVKSDFSNNPLDYCSGGEYFSDALSKKIEREKYCPFLEAKTDNRICQWVHSENHDPQKSKPVGQAAIALNIAGLVNLNTTANGRTQSIIWTENAEKFNKMEWPSKEASNYLVKQILGYGPILGLAYYLNNISSREIKTTDIKSELMVKPTNEVVPVNCDQGTTTQVKSWDGNTSSDASSRTTSALLSLGSSVGLVTPKGFLESQLELDKEENQTCFENFIGNDKEPSETKEKQDDIPKKLLPFFLSEWLIQRAKKGKTNFPRTYYIEKEFVSELLQSDLQVKKGINFDNFVPAATDRNKGNKCECCDENVVNNARKEYGPISRNRKMLLIEGLRKASNLNKLLDLKKLAETSSKYSDFHIKKDNQLNVLINIERYNVIFYGFPNQLIDKNKLKPLVKADKGAFGEAPEGIKTKIEKILTPDKFTSR